MPDRPIWSALKLRRKGGSSWPSTEVLMGAFYRELVAGALVATALQSAQRAVMQLHPHPYYWASFVLQGGW
jgi:CHAT domain-containing protein